MPIWSAPGTTLSITSAGMVDYERVRGHSNVSINGGVTAWNDTSFVVLGLSEFDVEVPPHRVGSGWATTIDGVVYRR
jgi:hypothetical protein